MSTPWAPVLITLALSSPALAETLKDPTRPPQARQQAAAAQQPLLLTAVLKASPAKAIINGQLVGQGEMVAGWRVSTIGGNQVQLRKGQQRQTLQLYPDSLVSPAKAGH
ncbi:hypothetical protein [Gallaecimonas xiamenensis]|uniref:hypothetical protein n=1 Tax=Gallaecimonas xiamenensis TaxID=1207039 RepID=UPI00178C4B09|nr:hypothetical protein [Gallaecimonas xiamenensis]